jgi:hypothetical protein
MEFKLEIKLKVSRITPFDGGFPTPINSRYIIFSANINEEKT